MRWRPWVALVLAVLTVTLGTARPWPLPPGALAGGVEADPEAPAPAPAGGDPAPTTGAVAGGTADCSPAGGYRPPLSAPITDPFRPPDNPFGPGNRGLEYATTPGSAVQAIGAGTVTFAGPVAGQLHVTVGHADGLRSTYSYLAEALVTEGQVVSGGQLVGRTGVRLHLGVRCGRTYLDPALLFGGRRRARLVPDHRFPAGAAAAASG